MESLPGRESKCSINISYCYQNHNIVINTLSFVGTSKNKLHLGASPSQRTWNPCSKKPSQITPSRATTNLVHVVKTPSFSHPHKQHWLSPGARSMSFQLLKASVLMLQPSFPLCPDGLVCLGDQREFPDPSTNPRPALSEEDYEEGRMVEEPGEMIRG